jgi:hypothetical protein
MLSKKVGWGFLVSTVAVFIIIHSLNSFIDNRKKSLGSYSQKITEELQHAKLRLSEKSTSLVSDNSFNESVRQNFVNSYKSVLSGHLNKQFLTNVGIYNKNCGLIFQDSINDNNSNLCRPKNLNKLYWVTNNNHPTLSITRQLASGDLLSMGLKVDESWLASIVGNFSKKSLKYNLPKFKKEFESLGAVISPSGINQPIISDDHFFSKNIPSLVHPAKTENFSNLPFFILSLCAMIYLLLCYLHDKAELETKFTELSNTVKIQSNKLNITNAKDISDILLAWENRLSDTSSSLLEKTHIIADLEKDLLEFEATLIDQTKNEAINIQIVRTLDAFARNLEDQKDSIDTIESLLKENSKLNLADIRQKVADWQFQIDIKGPRKFLRSGFETMSVENPSISKFEDDITKIIADTGNLEGGLIALINEVQSLEEKSIWTRKIIKYWNSLLSEDSNISKSQKLSETINQAIAQIKTTSPHKFSVETPSWTEPLLSTKAPSSVMTCMIFETLGGLITETDENKIIVHFRSGSMKDQLIVTKLDGKHAFSKEDSKVLQRAITKASSFARAYGIKVKLLAGTGNHISVSLSWNASNLTGSIKTAKHAESVANT